MAASLSRFQGALVGGVIGDCLGSEFEALWGQKIGIGKVMSFIMKVEDDYVKTGNKKHRRNLIEFTDDTAMARSVTKSLIQNRGLHERDMAKRFTEEYLREPGRGYGGSVATVFRSLADTNYADIYGPARAQFDGQGSYGNGGAMRISPAGVFSCRCNLDMQKLKEMSDKITMITHSNIQAIQGAFLQCYAVQLALRMEKLDTNKFIDELITTMETVEKESKGHECDDRPGTDVSTTTDDAESGTGDNKSTQTFCHRLNKIKEFINRDEQPQDTEVQTVFKFDISALDAVPAAIYCFLQSTKKIRDLEDRNEFERTIIYSISLGGDTDTIASMAGSIAGAWYGIELIPASWQHCSEGAYEALKDAKEMFNLKMENI
ncbi:ADP-ribose glycohydrolase ARH3 [Mactra antiquata]